MAGAYAVPVNTGSTLLMKLTHTSSEIFNRKIFALLDEVMTLESEYELTDPRLFVKDANHKKYGPLALIATIQASHGMLLSQQRWPALAASLPQSNNSSVSTGGSSGTGPASLNGRKCYRCQGDHLVKDCPVPAPADGTGSTASGAGTQRQKSPLAAWKYIKPSDVTVPRVDANGKTWKFCTKCKCRATQSIGIYQLSHWDSEHVDNYRRPGGMPAANPASTGDTSAAPPEVPVATSSTAPQSNLTSVSNPNPIPPGPPDVTVRPVDLSDDAHDMDQLEFTGMWCASVDDTTISAAAMFHAQLYCSLVDSPADADATITLTRVATSVFERESVPALLVETVVEDVTCDDGADDDDITVVTMFPDLRSNDLPVEMVPDDVSCTDSDDDDDITVVTMFPDPDRADHNDADNADYPSTDDDDDNSFDSEDGSDGDADDEEDSSYDDPWSTLSAAVRYDLEHPPIDDFYDASDVALPVTVYKGIEFFDPIEPPLISPIWFRPRPEHWFFRWAKNRLFWATTVFWDTIAHFVAPPPPLLRRIRRRRSPITVPAYPKAWMLLTSCLMLGLDAFRGNVPPFPIQSPMSFIDHAVTCGQASYERIERLEELVVLNPGTFLQYQAWQYRLISQILEARNPPVLEPTIDVDSEEFFDSYEQEPKETGEHFFDAMETEEQGTDVAKFDPFAVHELTHNPTTINCITQSVTAELLLDSQQGLNGPTVLHQGLSSAAFQMLAADPHAFMSIGGETRKPVIFDTGASSESLTTRRILTDLSRFQREICALGAWHKD
ncbi:hypothetical protein MHU86_15133 [Fragilaria crotonensis]|nr:hypothetical protein MHU86_15133 [Fragilaria crotonensis]